MPIEVETRDLGEVREVLALVDDDDAGVRVDRIMLDNMARRDPSAPGAPTNGLGAAQKGKAVMCQSGHARSPWRSVEFCVCYS